MAEPTQFAFSWTELAELLIKKQDIHEGKWMVALEFQINIGLMGLSPPAGLPGVMAVCKSVQLAKAQEHSPQNLIVDAAVVNPKTTDGTDKRGKGKK
jgi:hypothetical protein